MVRVVKDPIERRQEIVSTACHLFLSKGYENTTLKDVMDILGIAKGTIYHYFKSKEELLEAVIMAVVDEEMLRLRKIFDESEGNALERIRHMALTGSAQHGHSHDQMLEHLHQTANAGMHIQLLAQIVTMQAPLYAELIAQGCDEGIFNTDSSLECAEFLLSGIQFLTDLGIYPWSQEQLDRRWRAFPRLIESLLQAPEGSFRFLNELANDADNQQPGKETDCEP